MTKSLPLELASDDVTVVCVRTRREMNMGAIARAMKTQGFTRLVFVDPEVEPGREARAVAHGATDVLDAVRVVKTLDEALEGHGVTVGFSAREGRNRARPVRLRKFVTEVLPLYCPARVALVFGSEESGLSHEDLEHCQFVVQIPTGDLHHSLNLSHAVMVGCYELHVASSPRRQSLPPGTDGVAGGEAGGAPAPGIPSGGAPGTPSGGASGIPGEGAASPAIPGGGEASAAIPAGAEGPSVGEIMLPDEPPAARQERMYRLYRGIEAFLADIDYPNTSSRVRAMADVRRVLGGAYLTQRDVNTLLGTFRHIRWLLRHGVRPGGSVDEAGGFEDEGGADAP